MIGARANAIAMFLALMVGGCAYPQPRPRVIPTITLTDFSARNDCVLKEIGRRVRAGDSDASLQSSAYAATMYCSFDLWEKMRRREPPMSDYAELQVERDRADAVQWAAAQARDARELLRRVPPASR